MLEGVLVTEGKVLCVRHEPRERASKGPGDSMEAVDMLSKSGVPGSRYGLVVLMNVTVRRVSKWLRKKASIHACMYLCMYACMHGNRLTIFGNVHPDGIVVKGVFVGVEALERVLVARVVAVHRGIVLVAEDDA